MKTKLIMPIRILSIALSVVGFIWFLQGVSLLPGSFMTGRHEWAVYGGVTFAMGILLLLSCSRRGK